MAPYISKDDDRRAYGGSVSPTSFLDKIKDTWNQYRTQFMVGGGLLVVLIIVYFMMRSPQSSAGSMSDMPPDFNGMGPY